MKDKTSPGVQRAAHDTKEYVKDKAYDTKEYVKEKAHDAKVSVFFLFFHFFSSCVDVFVVVNYNFNNSYFQFDFWFRMCELNVLFLIADLFLINLF